MNLKRLAIGALLGAFFLSSPPFTHSDEVKVPPADEKTGKSEEAFTYTIVPHDTLWDISKRFLKNPFKWPRIWSINPYIKNPDLIYPGNVVKIRPDGTFEVVGKKEAAVERLPVETGKLPVVSLEPPKAVVLEPEAKEVKKEALPVPAPLQKAPSISSYSMARKGFIEEKALTAGGAIIGSKEEHILIPSGDTVFISFKDRSEVKAGARYAIFLEGPEIIHPVTKVRLGKIVDILGSIRITGTGDVIEGRIETSYKEISAGARLAAYKEPVTEVEITKPEAQVTGFIVASLEGKENLASGDIVYIDLGAKTGLKKGNTMRIYRKSGNVPDPLDNTHMITLPPVELGALIVLDADENTSSCVVVKSLRSISMGDEVSTRQLD